MTDEDIRKLDEPKYEDYDAKTGAAIAYAREWASTRGNVQTAEVIADFEKQYSPDERSDIIANIRIMDFANRFNNMWAKPIKR